MQPPSGGRALPALQRETSYGFIYLEVQPPARPFQGSVFENFEVTLDFGLTGFSFLVVCVCVEFLLPKQLYTPILSHLSFSLCWAGGAGENTEAMGNQACSRHLLMSSHRFLSLIALLPDTIPSDLSPFLSHCVCDTFIWERSDMSFNLWAL